MEWFHCNDCFKRDHSKSLFYLLPCGRILCSDCFSRNPCSGKPCQKCRANGYTSTTLKNDLPADVADFFRNPNLLLKKYIKVVDFQKRHRDSILNHMTKECQRLSAEYKRVKDTFHVEHSRPPFESLAQENQALKTAVRNLQEEIERLKASQDRNVIPENQWNRHHFNLDVPNVQTPVGPAADSAAPTTRLSTSMYSAPAKRSHAHSGNLAAKSAVRTTPNYGPSGSKRSTPSHPPAKKTAVSAAPTISRLVQNTPAFYHSTPLPAALPTPVMRSTLRPPTFQRPLPSVNPRLPMARSGYLPPSDTPLAGYIPRTNQSAYSFERVFSFMSSASQQAKSNLDKKAQNRQ